MSLSWGAVAGSFLATYLYGLFWRGVTKAGAWAGVLTGLGVSTGLAVFFRFDDALLPLIGSVAILLPLVVVPLVSLVTERYPEEHLDKIFGSRGMDSKKVYQGLVSEK